MLGPRQDLCGSAPAQLLGRPVQACEEGTRFVRDTFQHEDKSPFAESLAGGEWH